MFLKPPVKANGSLLVVFPQTLFPNLARGKLQSEAFIRGMSEPPKTEPLPNGAVTDGELGVESKLREIKVIELPPREERLLEDNLDKKFRESASPPQTTHPQCQMPPPHPRGFGTASPAVAVALDDSSSLWSRVSSLLLSCPLLPYSSDTLSP